ncbi:phage tail tape measure protein [Salmonella enterica]|nr:phage tail tape measure protein [Salmonella enterica]EJT8295198.1 phage tail tape measure protein [Salmonella enterica subsp. enterica serovar Agona]ECL0621893.1 phage tail tape measure protein [Salmonella enterica]EDJ5207952.1 phage tail tape measure protein [Salmonella enterica]EDR8362931.1 phage tail tape measure protein [Salmonella enterica]
MSHLDFTLSLIDKLTRPLKTAQSSLSGFAEKSQASFTKIGIGAAAVWGVAQSIAGVVGPAYEMNAALAEVGSKGVAEDALKRLSGEAMRFSMRYGKGAVDVVRSSYAMKGAMAGLSDMDLPRVTIAANTLAAGVKASGEEAGEYIGAMASRFNAELSSLGHVRFAEELAGKTAYMVQNFGVKMQTMQELIEGTKSAGADFGVSLDEQFAVLGTLSRTLGTEASGIYEQFLRSAPAAAEKLGMSFVDATGKMLPMGDILQKLQSKYGQSIEGNVKAQQALDAAFGGGADVIKKLYGQQDKLNRSITELGRNDGMKRAQEMAARMAEPWERIKAAFFAIRVAIGNSLIPILSPLMNGVADVGTKFARWLDMFPNIARWLGYITLGVLSFGLAGAAVNIVMGVFGFTMTGLTAITNVLTGGWKILTMTLSALRTALVAASFAANMGATSFLLMIAPVVLVVAAIGAVVVAVIKFWQPIKAFVSGFVAGFSLAEGALAPFQGIFGAIAIAVGWVWNGVKALFGWFGNLLSPVKMTESQLTKVTSAGETFGRVVSAAIGIVFAPFELVIRAIKTLIDMFGILQAGWLDVVRSFDINSPVESFEKIANVIGNVFGNLWETLKGSFANTYNWIVEKLNKIPGVNIDLKTVSPPAAAAVPANAVIPDSAAGSSKLNSPSVLTGNRINADIPRGGLMSQVKTDSKTAVDNRKSWGDTYINAPNGITPAQLAEWQELNAG